MIGMMMAAKGFMVAWQCLRADVGLDEEAVLLWWTGRSFLVHL
jgi:hypothetical protein